MREYSNKIALLNNARGVWSLDPIMGCASGTALDRRGCYNECYAARSARKYGYDFSRSIMRGFDSEKHRLAIVKKIRSINMPFVRMGTSGDPSENWAHTLSIIEAIKNADKPVVIITKHWQPMTGAQRKHIAKHDVCINTSVSAMDTAADRKRAMREYERLKPHCKSILRIVSCEFNIENAIGAKLEKIQQQLFTHAGAIDTVFRCSKNHALAVAGVINVRETKFLGKKCIVSKRNPKAYFGKCGTCQEMCGVNVEP